MRLLSDRRYRHLFAAQVMALVGTGLTTVGLALLASDLAGGRAGEVLGVALAIKMIAYVVVAPIAGAYATRLPRRSFLVGLDVARAAMVCLLPWVTSVWQIYPIMLFMNVCSAAFTPVYQATLPDIFEDDEKYTRALSLSRLAYDLENIASPMLAALLLAVLEFNVLFLMNGVGFVLSAAFIMTSGLRLPAFGRLSEGALWRIQEGIKLYFQNGALRGLFALNFAVAFAGSMQIVNTVVYVREYLGMTGQSVALSFLAVGAGSITVTLLLPTWLRRFQQRILMLTGGAVMGLSLLVDGAVMPGFVGLLVSWFFLGGGASLVMMPSGRLVKQACAPEGRPLLYAAQFALSHLAWLAAYPLAGWVGAQVGLSGTFLILSLLTLTATVIALLLWPRWT
tara:strand:+ start:3663 stop:4847 length:1185 start_codon:yes stop_codon:yes gene_type:complete